MLLFTAVLCLLLGKAATFRKPKNTAFYGREGFVTVSMYVLGGPQYLWGTSLLLNGDIPSVPDALFETISGFTTTGSTILTDIESLSKCSLF